jgi:hypothetical protein
VGLVAVHLVGDALVGESGGAGGGPGGVAVGVVAVVMGVKDVADGFGGEGFGDGDEFFSAGGVVGVDDDEVIAHLDDDGVAVTLGCVAEKEPNAWGDLLRGAGVGV